MEGVRFSGSVALSLWKNDPEKRGLSDMAGLFCPVPHGASSACHQFRDLMLQEYQLRSSAIDDTRTIIGKYPESSLTQMLQQTLQGMITMRNTYLQMFNGMIQDRLFLKEELINRRIKETQERIKELNAVDQRMLEN